MVPHFPPDDHTTPNIKSTAVAVDKDKNSPHAVRWAIDHLVISNPVIILIHVRHKLSTPNQSAGEAESGDSHDTKDLFVPYRAYCARKGIQLKEVVLEDNDAPKALLDHIQKNCISSIVVGASTRNALARKFKAYDIPGSLIKSAPNFCSVYVISKGKILSARTALRPLANTATPPKQLSSVGLPPTPDHTSEENGARHARTSWRNGGQERMAMERNNDVTRATTRERARSSPTNMSVENIELPNRGSRTSFSRNSVSDEHHDYAGPMMFGSIDISGQNLDFSIATHSPRESSLARQSARELEAEMKRLRLELKQTMEMYSSACKEAISAKNKARELHQWKLEEARKFEEARLAEEAALAMAELEKAKCKAAIEAAEAAQKLAEMEAQRRKEAEMKAKQEAEEKNRALSALTHNDIRYRKYTIEEIEAATEKFSGSMKIGEGGYGPVYKGRLDHTPVAIKVLRPDAAQGRKQFQQEVEVLSCIRHPNMVLLLGACSEYGCLVYEYLDNGSLEDRLFRRGNSPPIPWRKRFKIAAEIATALLFLHQAKPEPLVHRDLKPANILLDRNYVSKISDVGLARLVPPSVANSVTQYHMTSTAGTFCYIDPEYQQTGKLTTKSDIYSLGIMLLQIITAKPPMGLAHHVQRAIERERFAELLDSTVTDWPVEEALLFAKLSLKCAELRKKDRPDLATVVVPELNRLRELGRNSETHNNYGYNNNGGHIESHFGWASHIRI
ncbi:U-box domain-containing protein 35 [Corylus avellana]|uniref:U-box domain-containing protein 35 n=1 Tax=Corylus avellana TaxID=13451 RepID=UPI00286BEB86|nr:U-box domain-containing protein 35 [Corylus avellana]